MFKTNDVYLLNVYNRYVDGEDINIEEIIDYFFKKPIKISSIEVLLCNFKRELLKVRDSEQVKKLFAPEYIRTEKKNIESNSYHSRNTIKIPRNIVLEFLNLLKSTNYADLFIGLSIACGRRFSELLELNPIETSRPYYMLFKGQLKCKKPIEYEIPLLVSFRDFNIAFEKFKMLKPDISKKSIQNTIRQKLKKYNLKVHDLRRIYAAEFYERSDKSRPVSLVFQEILGHQNDSTSTSYNVIIFS